MTSERKLNVSLSLKIKGESTSAKVLPWHPFATANVAVLIHSFVHSGCAFGTTILFLYSLCSCLRCDTLFIIYFIYETFNDNFAFFKFESKTLFSI